MVVMDAVLANAALAGCEYGDQVGWCATYVQGPSECNRPEVATYCCQTCATVKQGTFTPGKGIALPLLSSRVAFQIYI